jgi:hypothetical protein
MRVFRLHDIAIDGPIAVLVSAPAENGEIHWILIGCGIILIGALARKRKKDEEDEMNSARMLVTGCCPASS